MDTLINLLLFESSNILLFNVIASPVVTLKFLGLDTNHYAVYIRVNAQTNCTSPVFKIGVGAIVASSTLSVANAPKLVETTLLRHLTNDLDVVLQFDFTGTTCVADDLAWI